MQGSRVPKNEGRRLCRSERKRIFDPRRTKRPSVQAAIAGANFGFAAGAGEVVVRPGEVQVVRAALVGNYKAIRKFRRFLVHASPAKITQLDAVLGQGPLKPVLSLREVIHKVLLPAERRRALNRLERAQAIVRRSRAEPLHCLKQDPSGLNGVAVDGRLPATIDKLLTIRRLKKVKRADLVTKHEVTAGNKVQLLPTAELAFEELLKRIESATDHIHLGFFIWKDDALGRRLSAAVKKKAAEGVTVRVLVDEPGQLMGGQLNVAGKIRDLRAGGVEVVCNYSLHPRPVGWVGTPDHRKLAFIDGERAFLGGVNIGNPYIPEWLDFMVEVEGAAVLQMHSDWMLTWMGHGGRLDPDLDDEAFRARYFSDPGKPGTTRAKVAQTIPKHSDEILQGILQLIRSAESEIWVTTPYLTHREVQEALRVAAETVPVRILVPENSNHRTVDWAARVAYPELVAAGAEIWLHPTMSHAKGMLVDRERGMVGSPNLDELSLGRVFELCLFLDDPEVGDALAQQLFLPAASNSLQLTPAQAKAWCKGINRVARSFDKLM